MRNRRSDREQGAYGQQQQRSEEMAAQQQEKTAPAGGQSGQGADLQRMMQQLEQGLGGDAAAAVKKLGNPQQLEGMLKGLSERDLARLESLMKNPERLRSLLTPENLQKLKGTLGG